MTTPRPIRSEELTGTFAGERFVFQEDQPDERTVIALVDPQRNGVGAFQDPITIKGRARAGELDTGVTFRFLGRWTSHPKYGRQFHFSSFTVAQPAGEEATVKYLSRGPGIGRRIAQQIWNLFGETALETIRNEPETAAQEVKGLSLARAQEAAAYFRSHVALERVTIEVNDLLAGRGFPKSLPNDVIRRWGEEAPAIIRQTPYALLRFRGVGFALTDSLYLELKHDPAAIERQGYCIYYALRADSEGHTWFPVGFADAALSRSIASQKVNREAAVAWCIEENRLARREHRGMTLVAEYAKAEAEGRLAEAVYAASRESQAASPRWPAPEACRALTAEQAAEYGKATTGFIGILAGSPGTGKTFVLSRAIEAVQEMEGAARISVCAPTGKAAVRASETLASHGISLKATTIHRLLKVVGEDGGDWTFEHDASNPLPLDYLIVDEASMIDATLLSNLLEARPAGCHVLLVGDPDQLSPVGHGAPLRDLIAAGLPCGHLKTIVRNEGRIVLSCAAIRDHRRIDFSRRLNLNAEPVENLIILDRSQPEEQIAELEGAYRRLRGTSLDIIRDVQVVVPVNEKSPLCRKTLNEYLQGLLNPNGERLDGCRYRVGDKVVFGKNGEVPLLSGDANGAFAEGKCRVANGEQGIITAVEPHCLELVMELPERHARVPRGKSDDGSEAAGSLDLAYAISVHKSQGSEWPVVIAILDGYAGARRLVDRHWLYTAISRAARFCVCIGPRAVATEAVRKSHMWRRRTMLRESIETLRAAAVATEWEKDLWDTKDDDGSSHHLAAADAPERGTAD